MANGLSDHWGERAAEADFLELAVRDRFLDQRRALRVELGRLKPGNVLVREADPIDYLALLFAALECGHAVTLADSGPSASGRVNLPPDLERWERIGSDWVLCGAGGGRPASGEILIPTGGTSGAPRLARHDLGTLRGAAEALIWQLGGGPLSSLCLLPLFHVSGLMQVVRALVSGGVVHFGDWKAWLASGGKPLSDKPVAVSLVFTQLQRVLAHPKGLEHLRGYAPIFLGGSGCEDAELLDRCETGDLRLSLSYGMTETAAMVTMLDPAEFLRGNRSVGWPLPGVSIEIEPMEGGDEGSGRLLVRGPGICNGYWGEAARERNSWWPTADRGRRTSDGLVIEGRLDRLLKTGGKLVDPEAVERALLRLPGVSAAVVTGLPDLEWGTRIVGVVQVPAESSATGRSLLQALRGQLVPHEIPKVLHIVASIPRRPTGKVDWEEIVRIVGR